MPAANLVRRLGNKLYKFGFPLYRPLYGAFKSYTDRSERNLLRASLSEGSIAVDGGANIGIYSQFLSNCVGRSGVVHSFEPDPLNYSRLRFALEGSGNVRLNQEALSDRTGESTLYVSDDLNVDHRLYPSEGERRRTLSIRSTRLDDYFKSGERVDLIKLDIQGYELHALRGAERVLNDNPAIKLLVEFWPYGMKQAGVDWSDFVAHLTERRMELQELSRKGLSTFSTQSVREAPDWYINLFAQRVSVAPSA